MNRDKYFKPDKCIPISDIKGFGIYDNVNKTFIGFNTNKGFLTVWNESKKAKLAFAYHTGNTIDERNGEYSIININVSHKVEESIKAEK